MCVLSSKRTNEKWCFREFLIHVGLDLFFLVIQTTQDVKIIDLLFYLCVNPTQFLLQWPFTAELLRQRWGLLFWGQGLYFLMENSPQPQALGAFHSVQGVCWPALSSYKTKHNKNLKDWKARSLISLPTSLWWDHSHSKDSVLQENTWLEFLWSPLPLLPCILLLGRGGKGCRWRRKEGKWFSNLGACGVKWCLAVMSSA